jgi:hypothetical protein
MGLGLRHPQRRLRPQIWVGRAARHSPEDFEGRQPAFPTEVRQTDRQLGLWDEWVLGLDKKKEALKLPDSAIIFALGEQRSGECE